MGQDVGLSSTKYICEMSDSDVCEPFWDVINCSEILFCLRILLSADVLSSGPFGTFASIRWNVILEAISDVNGLFVLIESGVIDVVSELLATYGFGNDRLITGGGRFPDNKGCASLGLVAGGGTGG